MIKKFLKCLVPLVVVAVIGTTVVSLGQGTQLGYKTTLDVWSGAVKINYNSQDMTSQLNPIVINGSTYLPLRSAGVLFSKNIEWNDATKTVVITDKADSTNATIAQLQNQIVLLKAELAEYEDDDDDDDEDLDDLEDELNDEYDEYKGADFEISLSGDEDDIEIEIETDEDDWDDISSSKQEDYLQDIVDDILDEFDDADIEGEVVDGSSTLLEFEVDSDGDVEADRGDIDDLEDDLQEMLEDEDFGEWDDIDMEDLEIELIGDEDDITFYINIDLDDYDDEWDDLSDDDIEDLLEDVYEEIEDDNDFGDADIDGYVWDTDEDARLVKVYVSSDELKFVYYD